MDMKHIKNKYNTFFNVKITAVSPPSVGVAFWSEACRPSKHTVTADCLRIRSLQTVNTHSYCLVTTNVESVDLQHVI
jgi:hypothetical protein